MDQVFSFSSSLGKEYIALLERDQKDMTNRADTPRRRKCRPGDRMYRYIDQRSKHSKQLSTRRCIAQIPWNADDIPETKEIALKITSPRPELNWVDFARKDGIKDYYQFVDYFTNHEKGKKFLCFVWSKPIKLKKLTAF